jgi:MFS family permease
MPRVGFRCDTGFLAESWASGVTLSGAAMMSYFRGWNVVVLGCLMQTASFGATLYSYATLMVPVTHEYGANRLTMNLGFVLMMFFSGIFSPLCALLFGRIEIRWLISAGAAVLAVGYGLIASSTAMWQVLLVYATAIAISEAALGMMTANVMVTQWFERRRGLAMGVCAVGTDLGGLILPPVASVLVVGFGWRHTYAMLGIAAAVVITAAAWLFWRGAPSELERKVEATTADLHDAPSVLSASSLTYGRLARRAEFWIYSFLIALSLGTLSGVSISIVPYAIERGVPYVNAPLLVSCMAAMAVVGKLAFGALADRISLGVIMLAGLFANLGAIATMLAANSYPTLVLGSLLLGLALGGLLPLWGVLVAQVFGKASYGKALGLMRAVVIPLSLGGPLLAGWLHDRNGTYTKAFSVFATAMIVAILLLLGVRRRHGAIWGAVASRPA